MSGLVNVLPAAVSVGFASVAGAAALVSFGTWPAGWAVVLFGATEEMVAFAADCAGSLAGAFELAGSSFEAASVLYSVFGAVRGLLAAVVVGGAFPFAPSVTASVSIMPLLSFPISCDIPGAAGLESVLPTSFAGTAGAASFSTAETGAEPAAGVVETGDTPCASNLVVASFAPSGGPGCAAWLTGTASCGLLCSPVARGWVAGRGLFVSAAAPVCCWVAGGGEAGACDCDAGCCWAAVPVWLVCVVGAEVSCFLFLPRLKRPLKSFFTLSTASGAVRHG